MKDVRTGSFLSMVLAAIMIVSVSCSKDLYYTVDTQAATSRNVQVDKPDPEIEAMVKPYKEQLDAKMNQVIGFAEKELVKGPSQSTLGNFVIDLILKKSEEYYKKDIDFALVTTGGLRTPIPQGKVTVGNIYELMPFENELVVLTLKGETVAQLLEHAVKNKNTQFAGLKYATDGRTYSEVNINGEPFNEKKTYTMAVSDYLASGGDHLGFLKDAESSYQLGKTFRGAILEHIRELSAQDKKIVGELDDRVVEIKY